MHRRSCEIDSETEIVRPPKVKFRIIGVVAVAEFHVCRVYAERLHKSYPKDYDRPDVRGFLDVDWEIFITKIRRRIGGEKLWALRKQFIVFKNDEVLGDDEDFLEYVAERYQLSIVKNYDDIAAQQLIAHLTKQCDLGRYLIYLTVAIDDRVVGTMLFQLYSDLVPTTCKLFLKRCKKRYNGYAGTPIQRIVIPSWIQCGGWKLKHCHIPCENYVIPHDKRGVLSMCHNGKHYDNSTQFFITLTATPWMDYKYVAFGQLIYGEEILKAIENVETNYEAPLNKIQIVRAGEFNLHQTLDHKEMARLNCYLSRRTKFDEPEPMRDESRMFRSKYKKGLYFAMTDLKKHMPFLHLPEYLIIRQLMLQELEQGGEEETTTKEAPTLKLEKLFDVSTYSDFVSCTDEEGYSAFWRALQSGSDEQEQFEQIEYGEHEGLNESKSDESSSSED